MKNIEILGSPDVYIVRSWLLPALFGGLLVLDFITSKKLNLVITFSFLSWVLIVAANRYAFSGENRRSKYVLEFGKTDLVCKFKNSIFWHIPFSKISHAVEEEVDSGTIFIPNKVQFLIYTKDSDSYSIPIKIHPNQIVEIKAAIERIANS